MSRSKKNKSTDKTLAGLKKLIDEFDLSGAAKKEVEDVLVEQNKFGEVQAAQKARELRNAAREMGAYREFRKGEESKRVLLVIPPKLLDDFQQLCDEDSYSLVEGIREAMRRMIWDKRPESYESPKDQQQQLESLVKFFQVLQGQQDPSTLPSQQKNTL